MPYALAFLLFFGALPLLGGQQLVYPLKHFSTRDGLPSAQVYEVLQDRRGYIWFGTDKGVARFNGARFDVFTTEDGLTDNTVFKLFEDAKGRIWVSGLSHSLCYFQHDSIVVYPHNDVIERHTDKADIHIFIWVDSLETVYLASQLDPGYYAFRQTGDFFTDTTRMALHPEYGLYALDARHTAPGRFPSAWLPALAQLEEALSPRDRASGLNLLLRSMGDFPWAFTSYYPKTYYQYTPSNSWEIWTSDKPILCSEQDHSGNRWLGKYTGGLWLEPAGASTDPVRLLSDHTVSDIFQDRFHGLWISTVQSGVYYLANPAVRSCTTQEGLRQGSIKAIVPQGNTVVFITHDDYAYQFDTATQQLERLPEDWKIRRDSISRRCPASRHRVLRYVPHHGNGKNDERTASARQRYPNLFEQQQYF